MREAYARGYASSEMHGVEVTVGLEIRDGDDVDEVTEFVRDLAREGLDSWGGNHMAVVKWIEGMSRGHRLGFHDRAYFIETEEDGKGVQVYDPRDFVKERCACTTDRCNKPDPLKMLALMAAGQD